MTRIVIAGAGIGGLAAAVALTSRGHDVVVLEADPVLRAGGAAISIWPNGHAALRALGSSLPDRGQRVERLSIMRADGRPLVDLDVARLEAILGFQTRLLRRRDLIEHLADQVPAGVVRLGQEVSSVATEGSEMVVTTAAGVAVCADLVIGADGHRSAIRRYVHDTGPARPTGVATWQGVDAVPVAFADAGRSLYIQGEQGWCGLMPAGDGHLQWWFDVPADLADAIPANERIAWLRDRFGDWPDPVGEVVAHLDGAAIETWHYTVHPVPKRLCRDRAVLIGDAAHAMPPSLAQGASQTLEDVLALVTALDRLDDITAACADYQRKRRRQAAIVSSVAASRLALYGPPSWVLPISRRTPSALTVHAAAWWYRSISRSLR